jgi:hypothetical protein
MRDLWWLVLVAAGLSGPPSIAWFLSSERVVVNPWMYEFADKQCEKGWRKITVTEKAIGVHCHGGGLHVLDWSMRRVANAD